jgi:hypothetical protein
MFLAPFPSRSPHTPDDLAASRDRLAAVVRHVAWHERRCAVALRHALTGVEHGRRRRIAQAEARDCPAFEIDRTRATLARRADGLRDKLGDLLARTIALGNQVVGGAHMAATHRAVEALLAGLQEIETAETHLVPESVNTDLGVGDGAPHLPNRA